MAVHQASAQLWVYEPFNYTAGSSILGQNGGTGFSGAWREFSTGSVPGGSFIAQSGSLSGPAGLNTSGGHALLTGEFGTLQPARDFSSTIAGADGTTTWISFLGQRQGPTTADANPYPRGVNVSMFNAEHPTRPERVGIGNSTGATVNEWSIIPEGGGNNRIGSGLSYESMAWAVIRIDHHGDTTVADDLYLWLNPDPLGLEPLTSGAAASSIGTFDYSSLDFLRPFVGNTASGRPYGVLVLDELRIGGDWAAMNAVPEPSSIALLMMSGAALFLRRRGR